MDVTKVNRTIVLVGSFNPAIFQPIWISQYGLLSDEEMEGLYNTEIKEQKIEGEPNLTIKIGKGQPFRVSNDDTYIAFKSFTFQINRGKAIFTLLTDSNLAIRFIKKSFAILKETPLLAYGFNFQAHFKFDNTYNSIIDSLLERRNKFIDSFGENVELGFNFKVKKNDCLISSNIEKSTSPNHDLYLSSNFHREIKGGASSLNDQDLEGQYAEAIEYYEGITQNLGMIKS